jgi:hypothetical protein
MQAHRAVTPPKGGMAAKPEGTFLNQKLYTAGQHSLTMDGVEDEEHCLHPPPPPLEDLATKQGQLLTATALGTFGSIIHLGVLNTPEWVRRS